MYILGINAYHPDSSACLIKNGNIICAVEEERFSRIKHCAGFPKNAIDYCLKEENISLKELDCISISKKPFARIHKKIIYGLTHINTSFLQFVKSRIKNYHKLYEISKYKSKTYYIDHHKSHSASAFFVSPFEKSAILTIDGFGDFLSSTLGIGVGNKIKIIKEITFPHSLGILYTAITQFLGFTNFGDEGKIMALASYGKPTYLDLLKKIIRTDENGFKLNLKYFNHHKKGISETWERKPFYERLWSDELIKILGNPRLKNEPINDKHKNISASLQKCLEDNIIHLLNKLYNLTGLKNICIAGGVALNCVANSKITNRTPFKKIFIQPASGDNGTSIGACFYLHNHILNKPRNFVLNNMYFGPSYSKNNIKCTLDKYSLKYKEDNNIEKTTAKLISKGNIIGWFQGKMEFGPRALGNRSILADPRQLNIKLKLNSRIKNRESFRPFAPSVLKEHINEFFENIYFPDFMIVNANVKPKKSHLIPAVVHIDGTSRIQCVNKDTNPKYWKLINEFYKLTNVPMLLNTSFNENEPIVCSPDDAVECFLNTEMDYLIIDNFIVEHNNKNL